MRCCGFSFGAEAFVYVVTFLFLRIVFMTDLNKNEQVTSYRLADKDGNPVGDVLQASGVEVSWRDGVITAGDKCKSFFADVSVTRLHD